MFNSKKFFALCATSIAGFSAVASIAPVSVFADAAKNGETVVTYEGTPKPAEWGLSVPANIKLNEGASNTGPSNVYIAKNCKLSIVKKDGTDYTDTQDKTFNINGEVANNGKLIGTEDASKKVDLNARIMDVGDPYEKTDTLYHYGIEGSSLKDQNIEATYKSDGSQKAERYVKFYADINFIKAAGSVQTSVSWTATEK